MTIVVLPIRPPLGHTLRNLMGIGPGRGAYPNFVSHRARLVELVCNLKHTSAGAWTARNGKKKLDLSRFRFRWGKKNRRLPRVDRNLDHSSVTPRRIPLISCPLLFCQSICSSPCLHRRRHLCRTSHQLILFSTSALLRAGSSLPPYLRYYSVKFKIREAPYVAKICR